MLPHEGLHNMDTLVDAATVVGINETCDASSNEYTLALIVQSHPQCWRTGQLCLMPNLHKGKVVELSRNFPDFLSGESPIGQPLADPYISRTPIIFKPLTNGAIEIDVSQSSTHLIVNGMAVSHIVQLTAKELEHGVVLELNHRICLLLKPLRAADSKTQVQEQSEMVGISSQLSTVRQQLQRLSGIDDTVLIRGATGVGKELVAQAIVQNSDRKNKPFIQVNLGAIPESLAAAELFGTQKGAYTGADKNRAGYFMAANGGTLFLDEIAEASPEVQAMLLRVLETGELFAVGSYTPVKVDVRLIAATDADLEGLSEKKVFKQPLLHRLACYEINLPKLNGRKEDIGLLFWHFAKQQLLKLNGGLPAMQTKSAAVWMPTELMRLLLDFYWPGNIRQLRNVARQLVIDNRNNQGLIVTPHLLELLRSQPLEDGDSIPVSGLEAKQSKRRKPNSVDVEELKQALEECRWELQAVAESLNISRASVYELMQRHGFRAAGDVSSEDIKQSFTRCQGEIERMVFDLKMSRHVIKRRINELGLETLPNKIPGSL